MVKQKPEVFFGSDRFELIAHMMGKLCMMSVSVLVHYTGVKWEGPQVELAAKI